MLEFKEIIDILFVPSLIAFTALAVFVKMKQFKQGLAL